MLLFGHEMTSTQPIGAAVQSDDLQDPLQDPLADEDVQMSKFDTGPASSRTARQVSSNDVENPRHVVDRAESDKTGFR